MAIFVNESFPEVAGVEDGLYSKAGQLAAGLNLFVDMELLLNRVLTNARSLSRAEAGSIYLVQDQKIFFAISQNDYLARVVDDVSDLLFRNFSLSLDSSTLAGHVALTRSPLTINNIDEIDPDSPYQHDMAIDNSTNYNCRAVMTLPLENQEKELLGVLQIINPQDKDGNVSPFGPDEEKSMTFFAHSASMALERALMLRSMALRNLIIISAHDPKETAAHAQRVASLAAEIYEEWAIRNRIDVQDLYRVLNIFPLAVMLHDIGKIRIPTAILTKPGRLTLEERAIMEGHVLAGARMFKHNRTPLDRMTLNVILDHHERWDGQGYPGWVDIETGKGLSDKLESDGRIRGKRGEDISIYGRITAVADVYDALSSRKAYKEPFDESLAVQILEQESGHHFDPQVVEAFLARRSHMQRVRERFPDDENGSE